MLIPIFCLDIDLLNRTHESFDLCLLSSFQDNDRTICIAGSLSIFRQATWIHCVGFSPRKWFIKSYLLFREWGMHFRNWCIIMFTGYPWSSWLTILTVDPKKNTILTHAQGMFLEDFHYQQNPLHGAFGNDQRSWNQNDFYISWVDGACIVELWFLMFMLCLELAFGIILKS